MVLQAQTDTGVTTSSYTNTSAAQGTWNVTVVVKNDNGSATQKWDWVVTVPGSPSILVSNPPNPVNDLVGTPRDFQHYRKSDRERDLAVEWLSGSE